MTVLMLILFPGCMPRSSAALKLDSLFNCLDAKENGIVGAAVTALTVHQTAQLMFCCVIC